LVTPGGAWVIDTKRYAGKAPEKRVEGGIIRPRVEPPRSRFGPPSPPGSKTSSTWWGIGRETAEP